MRISFWNTANLSPMIQVSSFIDGYLALKSCINIDFAVLGVEKTVNFSILKEIYFTK